MLKSVYVDLVKEAMGGKVIKNYKNVLDNYLADQGNYIRVRKYKMIGARSYKYFGYTAKQIGLHQIFCT